MAGHNMWEMIQKRLIIVMQRPYQMIQVRDQKLENENLTMELDNMRVNYGKMQLQVELEIKKRELSKYKLEKFTDSDRQTKRE